MPSGLAPRQLGVACQRPLGRPPYCYQDTAREAQVDKFNQGLPSLGRILQAHPTNQGKGSTWRVISMPSSLAPTLLRTTLPEVPSALAEAVSILLHSHQ